MGYSFTGDRFRLFGFIVVWLCLLLPMSQIAGVQPLAAAETQIMMQLFGWDSMYQNKPGNWYRLIESRIDEISDSGINIVWFPPASHSVSRQGYLPGDYYNLGSTDQPTFYGSLEQLKRVLDKFNRKSVITLADIVINHRCAAKQDADGIWNVFHSPSGKAKWENWAVVGNDYQFKGSGNRDSGELFSAAPDIDHHNKIVRKDISDWLIWLRELGFDGWRYDYVKGYAPQFVSEYNRNSRPVFSVSELWTSMSYRDHYSDMNYIRSVPVYNQDSHRQQLCDWLDNAGSGIATFDFTTKGILQYAVVSREYWRLKDSAGKAAGLIGWWPSRAVTFIDNHDTGSAQSHWPFPEQQLMEGYAYILTHPGTPCIFWEHYFDRGAKIRNEIKKLITIRHHYKIHSDSTLTILRAEDGLYAAEIEGKIAMKIGRNDWKPENPKFKLLTSGVDYAVWGLTTRTSDPPLNQNQIGPPENRLRHFEN